MPTGEVVQHIQIDVWAAKAGDTFYLADHLYEVTGVSPDGDKCFVYFKDAFAEAGYRLMQLRVDKAMPFGVWRRV